MKRVIPLVLLRRGMVVRAESFSRFQKIGNPIDTIRRLSSWSIDELIILETDPFGPRDPYFSRADLEITFQDGGLADLVAEINKWVFAPLVIGGGISSIAEMAKLFQAGADKVSINTSALANPELITAAAKEFGSQSIVVSIDAVPAEEGYKVAARGLAKINDIDPLIWAQRCEQLGAGEILVNSTAHDGQSEGLNCELLKGINDAVAIPVIGVGGVGTPQDIEAGFKEACLDAIAVGNHFHFKELSYPLTQKYLLEEGIDVRGPRLDTPWFHREPHYLQSEKRTRIAWRLSEARKQPISIAREEAGLLGGNMGGLPDVQYCKKCVVPSSSAIPINFDTKGVCSACRASEEIAGSKKSGPHTFNSELFETIKYSADLSRTNPDYDCIIAVSGGKDSYFQTYYIKSILGLRPLLVTYYGNNFTSEGDRNLSNMAAAFGVDHIIVKPSVAVLKRLNWLGFVVMGDMNWHNHVGLATVPFQVAFEKRIPFVIYGEHGYADLGGQFSHKDNIEWTYRHRLEHFARGYEWNYWEGFKGLSAADLSPYKYPSDSNLYDLGIRGLFLMNFVQWEGNQNAEIARGYGFRPSEIPSQRTYRMVSNLDDMHENGVHDYMRWIKFGYGRCTDHACKDLRAGKMPREEAVELVRQYDHRKPDDLYRWLSYVGMRESVFDRIADTFRDPRVWRLTQNGWKKRNVWDC